MRVFCFVFCCSHPLTVPAAQQQFKDWRDTLVTLAKVGRAESGFVSNRVVRLFVTICV